MTSTTDPTNTQNTQNTQNTTGSVTYRTVNNSSQSSTAPGSTNWQLTGNGSITSSTGWTISSSGTASTTLAPPVAKTNLSYIIMRQDGSVLEFEEQNPLTGKEMIGISKFFAAVTKVGYSGISVRWTELIANLGIARHFKPGTDISSYDSSGQTYYVKLVDAR